MILGITGYIGAGKTVVADLLAAKYNFRPRSFGDEVRKEATELGIPHERPLLQELGDRQRKAFGGDYWGRKILATVDPKVNYCIEGLRNPEEVHLFRNDNTFQLLCVEAPEEMRMERLLKRQRKGDPTTKEEFYIHDRRDKGYDNASELGQNTAKVVPFADIILFNDGSIADLEARLRSIALRFSK